LNEAFSLFGLIGKPFRFARKKIPRKQRLFVSFDVGCLPSLFAGCDAEQPPRRAEIARLEQDSFLCGIHCATREEHGGYNIHHEFEA
jgi:hypothetical protein